MRLYKFEISVSNTTDEWTTCHTDDRNIVPPIVTVTSCNLPPPVRYVYIHRDQVQTGSEDDLLGKGVVLNFCEFQVFGRSTSTLHVLFENVIL